MSKLILTDIANLQNEATVVSTLAANNAATETALENTLSRDGTAPNSMNANLDMNSYRILNLPKPASDSEPVRLIDLNDAQLSATVTVGTSDVMSGTNGKVLYDNAGKLGEATVGEGLTLGTGTLAIANPAPTTKGGVKSLAPISNQFLTSIGTDGTPAQAQPAFTDLSGSIAGSQIPNNTVTNAMLAQASANTIRGNPTGSTANVQDFTIPGLTHKSAPVNADYLMIADSASSNAVKYSTKADLLTNFPSGWVDLKYNGTAWVCTAPDGTSIDLTSAGTDAAAMIQIGINYAQTNGYNFRASGPSVDSAGSAHVASCASTITIGPADNKIYDIRLGTLQWNNFNSYCINIKTMNQCRINLDCSIEHSTSVDSSTPTVMWTSGSPDPRYLGTIYQHTDFYCRSLTAFGTHRIGFGYLFNLTDPNYQIVQSNFYLGSVDGGPSKSYINCLLFNNPSTTGGAIGDNRFRWSRFVGWSSVGIRVNTVAQTTDLTVTNYFEGAMENTATGSQSFIDSYGRWDTWNLTSIDTNSGTAGDGFVIRGSNNYIVCPWIVCSGVGMKFMSGANQNIAIFNNATGGTGDLSDSGSQNTVMYNGYATALSGSSTNDSAAAGHLGEYVTSYLSGPSKIAITSATPTTITSITLTPGDWDIHGFVIYAPAGTTTISRLIATINTTTNALPSAADEGYHDISASFTTGASQSLPTGNARVSISSNTTYYLIGQATFGTSTMQAYGRISARRAR